MSKLTSFKLDDKVFPVSFIETMSVKDGVECDVYVFTKDNTKDLAIVRVTKGYRTPLQRILMGAKTVEGYVDGRGTLTVQSKDGESTPYVFKPGASNRPIIVEIGQIMQWHADGDTDLVFYEVCEPPYVDGRFENLVEEKSL